MVGRRGPHVAARATQAFDEVLADTPARYGVREEVSDEQHRRLLRGCGYPHVGWSTPAVGRTASRTGTGRRLGNRNLVPESPNAKLGAEIRIPSTSMFSKAYASIAAAKALSRRDGAYQTLRKAIQPMRPSAMRPSTPCSASMREYSVCAAVAWKKRRRFFPPPPGPARRTGSSDQVGRSPRTSRSRPLESVFSKRSPILPPVIASSLGQTTKT